MADTVFLIVGLGNPGSRYALTRHNAGFLAIDHFADTVGCGLTSTKWQGEYCRLRLAGSSVILLKPQTYMNRSGECVARFVDYFRISRERILVLHDDLDLPAGRIKVVARGGAGGHNGIRSIIRYLGGSDFARIKIGIGRPPAGDGATAMPVERWVLARFSEQELAVFEENLEKTDRAIRLYIEQGIDACMNEINRR
ncbi:MAG TPA: aminoacyl-tRNA hydrolase [Desulfobulbus sp.]|nr:aminoacyl-tRNA hydrolase [Desulfobulbus sp.]